MLIPPQHLIYEAFKKQRRNLEPRTTRGLKEGVLFSPLFLETPSRMLEGVKYLQIPVRRHEARARAWFSFFFCRRALPSKWSFFSLEFLDWSMNITLHFSDPDLPVPPPSLSIPMLPSAACHTACAAIRPSALIPRARGLQWKETMCSKSSTSTLGGRSGDGAVEERSQKFL